MVKKLGMILAMLAFGSLHAYAKGGHGDGQAMTPGKSFRDCPECPEMVVIPAGSFDMGVNDGEPNEKPVHRVTIARNFALGRTEITQGQWKAIMGDNPSKFVSCGDNCPVEMVSWDDAQEFIRKLNEKTGKQYRLPSEAEWEYACHAGGKHSYCGSDDMNSIGWYGALEKPGGNSGNTTNPVATKQPNAFGLYDMSGNVWEWVQDSYHKSYEGAPADGSAWEGEEGSLRVPRGGSWGYLQRAAKRSGSQTKYRLSTIGLRVARSLP